MSRRTGFDRMPPSDNEAETAVLASCLCDPAAIYEVLDECDASHFMLWQHRAIMESIIAVHQRGDEINQITVAHDLGRRTRDHYGAEPPQTLLDEIGGMTYLSQIIRGLSTSVAARFYARIVKRDSHLRDIITFAADLQDSAYNGVDPDVLLDSFDMRFLELRAKGRASHTRWMKDVIDEVAEQIEAHMENPRKLLGKSTGWSSLDLLIDGLRTSCLYIWAAETGIGKSLAIYNMARHLSNNHTPSIILSTEMTDRAITQRIVYMEAGKDKVQLRKGGPYPEPVRDEMRYAIEKNRGKVIGFTLLTKLSDVLSEIRRQHVKNKVNHFFVDHLDDITVPGKEGTTAVDEKVKSLKALSLDLDIHISAVSQLARVTDNNRGRRLNRLKDGSGKEQGADVALFLEPVSKEGKPLQRDQARFEQKENGGWINLNCYVEKNREGPEGIVPLILDWRHGGRITERAYG